MSIINLIKTSLYSIKAHKLRVFLTMIGIIIGISSTVAIKSIGDGLSEYITSSEDLILISMKFTLIIVIQVAM